MNAACVFCGHSFASDSEGRTSTHVCAKCGAPQPVPPNPDFFGLLGVKRAFHQDLPELETRFYAISRALHPDRFAAGPDSKWKVISVERMSAVNRAYNMLSKGDQLRNYLLEIEGVAAEGAKAAIPAELAEEWFELQDSVMEAPSDAEIKLGTFERELKRRTGELDSKIAGFEREYDSGTPEPRLVLRKIEKLVLDGQYLKSMERDLQKLKSRLGI